MKLQTDNHTITSSLNFFTGQMLFLKPKQQCQSTDAHNSQSERPEAEVQAVAKWQGTVHVNAKETDKFLATLWRDHKVGVI